MTDLSAQQDTPKSWEQPAGSDLACTLEALSPSFATVGGKVLELEPSQDRTRRFTEEVVTTSRATTGIVRACWIREDLSA